MLFCVSLKDPLAPNVWHAPTRHMSLGLRCLSFLQSFMTKKAEKKLRFDEMRIPAESRGGLRIFMV